MILLQIGTDIADKLVQASPYTTAVYGILVLCLSIAVFVTWNAYKSEKDYNRERDNKILEILPLILDRLNRHTGMADEIKEMSRSNIEIKRLQDVLNDKIQELSAIIKRH